MNRGLRRRLRRRSSSDRTGRLRLWHWYRFLNRHLRYRHWLGLHYGRFDYGFRRRRGWHLHWSCDQWLFDFRLGLDRCDDRGLDGFHQTRRR
jgi:hypothetical protein